MIVKLINSVNGYNNKVSVIKSIRQITNWGLLDSKNAAENPNVQILPVWAGHQEPGSEQFTLVGLKTVQEAMRIIRVEGGTIGPSVNELLEELRTLAKKALDQQEDELASEIFQLVLAEKLRRQGQL